MVKNPPAIRETSVQSLGWEDPLEEGMTNHSSILAWRIPMDEGAWWATVQGVTKNWTQLKQPVFAWRIPWTEEPGGLQSMDCKESDMTEQLTHNSTLYQHWKGLSLNSLNFTDHKNESKQSLLVPWPGHTLLYYSGSPHVLPFCFRSPTSQYWRRKWQPTPVFLPRESCGQRSWWAAVHRVTQSRTRLKWLSSSSSRSN